MPPVDIGPPVHFNTSLISYYIMHATYIISSYHIRKAVQKLSNVTSSLYSCLSDCMRHVLNLETLLIDYWCCQRWATPVRSTWFPKTHCLSMHMSCMYCFASGASFVSPPPPPRITCIAGATSTGPLCLELETAVDCCTAWFTKVMTDWLYRISLTVWSPL